MKSDIKPIYVRQVDGVHAYPGREYDLDLGDGYYLTVGLFIFPGDKVYSIVETATGLKIPSPRCKTQKETIATLRSDKVLIERLRRMYLDDRHWNIMVANMESEMKRYHREHPEDINTKSAD